jgi:hypothetical protein
MNFRFSVVETSLNRAEFRWKWLRFVRHSSVLGILLCLVVLTFGVAIQNGWVTSTRLTLVFLGGLAATGVIAFIVLVIRVSTGAPDRNWLAAALERIDRRFLDRLNTLLFLETRRGQPSTESFALRIARQTQKVVAEKAPPSPFPGAGALAWFLALVLAVAATFLLNHAFAPWTRLLAAQKVKAAPASAPKRPLELSLPPTNNIEQNQAWGEVRITDPGADLKVTKVDVVPLQIEAAANQSLQRVEWFSTINGAEETPHPLPPPAEPRYAVYQPTIFLDELQLSDWDVMTYYAKARTEKANSYASEVYFLEVRPFREDILKMPGGEGGKAYATLSDLSALINRQQHIIRQTHQHLQKPQGQEALQAQDRKKLAEAETDLSKSTRHLYADMAAGMENKPIGEALDNLAKAEKSLDRAGQRLQENVMNEAQNHERSALSELVAARKMFQKAVCDHPDAFNERESDVTGEDQPPVADHEKRLKEIAEFRNEAKAAQDFVRKTLEQQKGLEQEAKTQRSEYSRLGGQEQQLQKALEEFQTQYPRVFKQSEAESNEAQQAMSKAAAALQGNRTEAPGATREATQALEKLSQAMLRQSAGQQLANAYKLRKMLDQQMQTLDQMSKPANQVPPQVQQQVPREARETVEQLRKTAEQEPTRDAFDQPLRDALSGDKKVELDAKLRRLEQSQQLDALEDAASHQRRAADARDALGQVARAFDQSQPKSLQMARRNDALKPAERDRFSQGMNELDSLIKQLQNGREVSAREQAKQVEQALVDLQTGMRSQFGDNDRGNQLLAHLEQMLKTEALDIGDLQKLMDELQHFSVETSEQLAKEEDQPEVTNIDPARLPPAYRGRIEKYFQRLSER